jgi:hypothetical protein
MGMAAANQDDIAFNGGAWLHTGLNRIGIAD